VGVLRSKPKAGSLGRPDRLTRMFRSAIQFPDSQPFVRHKLLFVHGRGTLPINGLGNSAWVHSNR